MIRIRAVSATLVITTAMFPAVAKAAGDFPLASCKSWNGTVIDRTGKDSKKAVMKGVLTKADFQEYCERDPGGETKAYGGSLTVDQCVRKYTKTEAKVTLSAEANCRSGALVFSNGSRTTKTKFPLERGADTSCASGMPPLVAQFQMLCPKAAAAMGIQ